MLNLWSVVFILNEKHDYIICTSKDGSLCVTCELKDALNCRYDESLWKCFRKKQISYEILGFFVVGVAAFFTTLWWAFLLYAVVIILNFAFIETLFLCRHCPFYEKEGKTLECLTLKGLPRIWSFDPSPITRSGRLGMGLVGGFVDLFPLLMGGYASWVLFSTNTANLLTVSMILLTVISLIAVMYLERYIGENYCKRCVNLSCILNKVPEELKDAYLRKNPELLKIWEACGYALGDKLIRENHSA